MSYVAPADFTLKGKQPWTEGLVFDDTVDTSTTGYLSTVITLVQETIENALGDTFEPPSPDNDVTYDWDSQGGTRFYAPRRIRSITTLSLRDQNGTLTAQPSTLWRLTSSTSGADLTGTYDTIDVVPGMYLTVGGNNGCWPIGPQTVRVVGKFGFATTPTDIKRLTALLVYDHMTPAAHALRRVTQLQTTDATYTLLDPTSDNPTGIAEADRIIRTWRRSFVGVR